MGVTIEKEPRDQEKAPQKVVLILVFDKELLDLVSDSDFWRKCDLEKFEKGALIFE